MIIMKKKILILIIMLSCIVCGKAYASASISAPTTVYAGDSFTITLTTYSAAWNLHVSATGVASCSINQADGTEDLSAVTKIWSKTCTTSGVGTVTIRLTGDWTGANGTTIDVDQTLTVNVIARPQAPTTTTTKRVVYNTTKNPQTTLPPVEETTTIPETTTQPEFDISLSIVGYEIPFDKNKHEYTIKVDNSVTQLYVNVEGEDIVRNSGIVDIKDKDAFDVTVMHGEEELKYTFNVERVSSKDSSEVTVLKNNIKGLKAGIIVSCAVTLFMSTFSIILAIKNKGNLL